MEINTIHSKNGHDHRALVNFWRPENFMGPFFPTNKVQYAYTLCFLNLAFRVDNGATLHNPILAAGLLKLLVWKKNRMKTDGRPAWEFFLFFFFNCLQFFCFSALGGPDIVGWCTWWCCLHIVYVTLYLFPNISIKLHRCLCLFYQQPFINSSDVLYS